MKKKILSTAVFILMLAGVVWGAQLVIDTVGTYDTPQKMMQAIDDNFDELYGKWVSLGTTHDTSGELDALYESELDNSAGLASALSDETGTGVSVFATSPTLVTPNIGTPSAGVLTNCTGLTTGGVASATLVTAADTIAGNDNDTTFPTSAAVKDYADSVAAGGGLATTGGTMTGNITLDDGTGASPSIVFTDATDESTTITKTDGGYTTFTTVATDGLQILTGNLMVGNAEPNQTINGEDAYVEGLLEVDGVIHAEGGVTGNVTGNVSGTAATVTEGTQASITTAANLTTVGALAAGSLAAGFTPVTVPIGGTGAATLTDHGVLLGSGTGAITPLAAATNGQLVIGSTGADPVLAALAETGDALVVTNGAGTVTLSAHANVEALADGTIDSVVIGGTTPAAITGTTITGSSFVSSAADGAHYMTALNTAALSSTPTDGNLAFLTDRYYLGDGSDYNDYLISHELIDSPAELETIAGLGAFFSDYADDADASTMRTTLGLAIGTNVQAYDADLTTWAGVTPGTGIATALAVNTGSAGAPVLFDGAGGTPSGLTLTNATGLPTGGLVDDAVTFAKVDDDGNFGPFTGTWEWNAPFEVYSTSSGDQTIASAQLGIKLDEDLIVTHGGAAGEVQDEAGISLINKIVIPFDPEKWYDNTTNHIVSIMKIGDEAPHGITITEWSAAYLNGDPTTELDADIMCDTTPDWNPAANGTVMDVIDTTAGVSSADTGFDSATCANGSNLYVRFGADPADSGEIVHLEISYYVNED